MGTARLADRITATGELLYVNRDVALLLFRRQCWCSMPVAPVNPYNPFGTTVLVNRLLTEYPSQSQSVESDMLRWAVALHGDWARGIGAVGVAVR